MSARICLLVAALSGFMVVVLGAFAAHALRASLPDRLYEVFQTGVQYQMFHTLALFMLGHLLHRQASGLLRWSAGLWCAGMLLFCGSLYLLALTGSHWLGAVTPLGGLCFLSGWLTLAIALLRHK